MSLVLHVLTSDPQDEASKPVLPRDPKEDPDGEGDRGDV